MRALVLAALLVSGIALGQATLLGGNSSGGISLRDRGSAAAPSFSFQLDPDTGMYSSGANTIDFSTGGTKRVSIGTDLTPGVHGTQYLGSGTLYWNGIYSNNFIGTGISVNLGTQYVMQWSGGGALTLSSDMFASTATSSVAAINVYPNRTLDANDLLMAWKTASAGSTVASIDLEGDIVAGGLTSQGSASYFTNNATSNGAVRIMPTGTAANTYNRNVDIYARGGSDNEFLHLGVDQTQWVKDGASPAGVYVWSGRNGAGTTLPLYIGSYNGDGSDQIRSQDAAISILPNTKNVVVGGGVKPTLKSLSTCDSSIEGQLETDVLSGASTGKRTKLCLCTSDGAAAYAWQNVATATIGTGTTCGTE